METLTFLKNNQQPPIEQVNSEIPTQLRNSKSVYLCHSWLKICFVITILILLFIREIFFSISEKQLTTLLNLVILNRTSSVN